MRFIISTHFNNEIYNVTQRLEIKTNELQKAFETCRAFVIGSKSCKIDIFENKNRTKNPDYVTILGISDVIKDEGILTNVIIFMHWIFKFRERSKKNVLAKIWRWFF